jgi:glyoxylase-like metal-dependent hydrolase (beta-lactamase superfamily II)
MTNEGATVAGDRVVDGVGRIPGFVNSYTFSEGNETWLIDTGFHRRAKPILRAFESAHVPLASVRKLLLTHHHGDHRGGAAYLRERTQAPISCHREDVPYVDGRTKPPMPLIMRLIMRTRPAPVAVPLNDGDQVGPLQVLHAPGHTPGEVVFYHPARKILFSGDAVVESKGQLTLPGARYASNLGQAVQSLSRLRALEIEALLPGHGVPVLTDVRSRLDDLIQRAPHEFLGR